MTAFQPRQLDIPKNSSLEELSEFGQYIGTVMVGCRWWLGDLARYAAARFPDTYQQAFPESLSPDEIARCKAVAEAYQPSERNPLASWTIHMRLKSHPDRIQRVQDHVDNGRTSDEARQADSADAKRSSWLIAIDVNYHLHRHWHSGADVEAASRVSEWIQRTVERLKDKGLTDVVCCFDDKRNFRKELTAAWEDKYKDRPPKDSQLVSQLHLVRELLTRHGFCCVSIDGMEADDIMCSASRQFDGKTTLLTNDKDVRQCLSDKCNILLGVDWSDDELGGAMVPEYNWLSVTSHTDSTGVPPEQWTSFQMIMGDSVDGIKGAPGIGESGAKKLLKEFGTPEAAILAARNGDERLLAMNRGSVMAKGLLELEPKLEVTRQLVTLVSSLQIPSTTRIPG